ncbi:MAG: CZB domain-containing protein [Alphaproteobacteria bacterium]|nr:CZB domain-containing protein [Alphaproteobacteria bacterium]
MDNDRMAAIEVALDLVLEGRYLAVADGDCAVTRKIKALARHLETRGLDELKRVVDLSMTANEAITATAEMMRDVREVDQRASGIASAAEELVASVQEIARNAAQATDEARTAESAATRGEHSAQRAVATMESIAGAVAEAAAKVHDLADASSQIGDIVNQIEAIAKQTNLLALNATIEAARAGEAGKGFAVVATEVKALANQTARATVDIRVRIDSLRGEMDAIVDSMEEGARAVQHGQEVIQATGDGMRGVTSQINVVTHKIEDISAILGQQTEALSEVSQAIAVIARMTARDVEGIGQIIDVLDRSDATIAAAVGELMKLELTDKTVLVAKSDHMIWRKRLAQMMVGRLTLKADELADHHQCRLGKWYDSVKDPDLTGHPAFRHLVGPHAEVHKHGIEAARRFENGDLDGALVQVGYSGDSSLGCATLQVPSCHDLSSAK